jgi:hypothetical protein
MKSKYNLAVKFFTESKNEEQLQLTYNEFEKFMTTYNKFKYYLNFSLQEVSDDVLNELTDEEKYYYNFNICRSLIDDVTYIRLIDEFKFKLCEDIFGSGDFNFELFQYALEKIFAEERKLEEEEEKRLEESRPRISFYESVKNSSYFKYLSGAIVVASIGTMGIHYYLYSSSAFNSLFS